MRCYLFDLDGTLCDISHRLHYIKRDFAGLIDSKVPHHPTDVESPDWRPDWDSFFAACVGDVPIEPLCSLANAILHHTDIVFVSGRSEVVRKQTQEWLWQYVPRTRNRLTVIYMRRDGDHRPDHIVKGEMLDAILAAGWQPIMAFDDRKQVVDMWRSRGLICAQVAEGDF